MVPPRRRPRALPSEKAGQQQDCEPLEEPLEEARPLYLTEEEQQERRARWASILRIRAKEKALAQVKANTATDTGSTGKGPKKKKQEVSKVVPEAAGAEGAKEAARQDGRGARNPGKSALQMTKTVQKISKETVDFNSGTGSDGMAIVASGKPDSNRTSGRSVPNLPESVAGHVTEGSDTAAERHEGAKNSGSGTTAKSRNAGAEDATKSTCPRGTAQDKDDGTVTKPRANVSDVGTGRPKSPESSAPPAQKTGEKPGEVKRHQAQQAPAGKPGGGSAHPVPDSAQRKDKAQGESYAATPRGAEHNAAATVTIATQPSAISRNVGRGPSEKSSKSRDWLTMTRKRRAASAPIEDGGRTSKRFRLEDGGEADWRTAPVIFAPRQQDRGDDAGREADAPVEEPAAGIGDVHLHGEGGGGHAAGAVDGRPLALPEQQPGIELTNGFGAVMGLALGAGAFALRHWT